MLKLNYHFFTNDTVVTAESDCTFTKYCPAGCAAMSRRQTVPAKGLSSRTRPYMSKSVTVYLSQRLAVTVSVVLAGVGDRVTRNLSAPPRHAFRLGVEDFAISVFPFHHFL